MFGAFATMAAAVHFDPRSRSSHQTSSFVHFRARRSASSLASASSSSSTNTSSAAFSSSSSSSSNSSFHPFRASRPSLDTAGRPSMDDPDPSERTLELDVCMIDDGWALLFHPKSELHTTVTIPEGRFTSLPTILRNTKTPSPGSSPSSIMARASAAGGTKVRNSLPPSFKHSTGSAAVSAPPRPPLTERRNVPAPTPLLPVSLPPPTGPLPAVPDVLPRRASTVRFAQDPRRAAAAERVECTKEVMTTTTTDTDATTDATSTSSSTTSSIGGNTVSTLPRCPSRAVAASASLNETLRLRSALQALQARHTLLYDTTIDARNEIARLRHELASRKELTDHLVAYALSLRTENDVLREQIPGERGEVMPYAQTSAGSMEAMLSAFGGGV